jgi:hypothetical protein
MKEKILAQLVSKYAGVSKKFLGLWADKLVPKVTEETQIEGVVNELENLPITIPDLAAEWQREGDTRVTEAKKEWEKKNPPKPPKTDTPPEPPKDDDVPAWAKTLIDQNKTLSEKIQGFEKDKTLGSIKQQLQAKLKDVPASIWSKRAMPETEDAIDAFVTEVQEDYKTDFVDKGLITPAPGGSKGGNTKPTEKEVDALVDKIINI